MTPAGTPASAKQRISSARRGRRFLRRLDDDRAAGGQRAGQLAHHLVDREVPRREGGDRPDRLLNDELIDALGSRRNDPAIGAARLLGEPVDDVGAGQRLALGLGQRLALLQGQQRRDRVGALAQQVGGLAHDLRAIERRDLAPGRKPLSAASRARSRSLLSACATVPIGSPVAGLTTGIVRPPAALVHARR